MHFRNREKDHGRVREIRTILGKNCECRQVHYDISMHYLSGQTIHSRNFFLFLLSFLCAQAVEPILRRPVFGFFTFFLSLMPTVNEIHLGVSFRSPNILFVCCFCCVGSTAMDWTMRYFSHSLRSFQRYCCYFGSAAFSTVFILSIHLYLWASKDLNTQTHTTLMENDDEQDQKSQCSVDLRLY